MTAQPPAGAAASPVGLELRIHGVHGTSPGAMLGVGSVEQVAGDGLTGVFRSADGTVPYRDLRNGPVVEAYSWGALTSGVPGALGWLKRALWLLLLPFSLANLAYWARLRVGGSGPQARYGVIAVRWSSLLLTVFFLITACLVSVDLFAWQCYRAGIGTCPSLPGFLDGVAGVRPGQRLAIGVLGPVVVVALLFALSHTTMARYEATGDPTRGAMKTDWGQSSLLRHPDLWRGELRTKTLRDAHIAAALATVVCFVAVHVWSMRSDSASARAIVALGLLAAVELLAAAVVVAMPLKRDVEVEVERGWNGLGVARGILALSVATLLAVEVLLVVEPRADFDELQDYSGENALILTVFVLLTILHLSLFTSERLLRPWTQVAVPLLLALVVGGSTIYAFVYFGAGSDVLPRWSGLLVIGVVAVTLLALTSWHWFGTQARHKAHAWSGAGASVLLAAAVWIALLFTTAAVTGVANFLNGNQSVAQLRSTLELPAGSEGDQGTQLPAEIHVAGPVTVDPLAAQDLRKGDTLRQGTVTVDSAYLKLISTDPGSRFQLTGRSLRNGALLLDSPIVESKNAAFHVTQKRLEIDGPVDLVVTGSVHSALVLPSVLLWAPIAQLAWLALALVTLGLCIVIFGRRVGSRISAERSNPAYFQGRIVPPGPPPLEVPLADRPGVVKTRRRAALAHRAEELLNYTGAITAPVALALVAVAASGRDLPTYRHPWIRPVSAIAMYVVLGVSAGLIGLGAKLRDSEGWRKTIGVIWDLVTFWPRAAHPLSPPCYTERVVPEVLTRLDWARGKHKHVVVSAHSQGSTIAVAALMRTTDLEHVRLVTYGSQIRGLYGRIFPGVFGPGDVGYRPTTDATRLWDPDPDLPSGEEPEPPYVPTGSLRGRIGRERWRNMFRRGDPLGYRVFSDNFDDEDDRVVLEVPDAAYGDPGPTVKGHSGYQHSPEYRATVAEWTGEPFVGPPATIEDVQPLPDG